MAKGKKNNNKLLYSEHELNHYQKVAEQQKLANRLLDELNADHRFDDFFAGYRADTIESFKRDFARFKAAYLIDGDWYKKHMQSLELKYFEKASEMLWHIQQKKLFDLQCLWRAEKITLPKVEAVADFEYWSVDIKRCPFLDPITESEAELLQRYVSSLEYNKPLFELYQWMDYDSFVQQHQGDEQTLTMPEWYHFYNMHRGTQTYMLLPDIRGKKEDEYTSLAFNKSSDQSINSIFEEKVEKKQEPVEAYDEDDPPPYESPVLTAAGDGRPWMKSNFTEFIEEFEDNELKEIHQIRIRLDEHNLKMFDYFALEEAFETLRLAGNNYPMQPHYNWQEGILQIAKQFEQEKIAAAIPLAFEEYNFKVLNNITPFIKQQEKKDIAAARHSADVDKKLILLGRKLKNEPQNFDF